MPDFYSLRGKELNSEIRIGVLALQGAFREHAIAAEKCGMHALEVRLPSELDKVDALIIPGGESTTITKLMHEYGFPEKIRSFASCGKPIFGTCAGLIVLANKIHGEEQNFLHLIDINIERNAYGRQIESREVDLTIEVIGKKAFRAVFIRAPQIKEIGNDVISLASYEGLVIMARQKNILVATFHPELTGDLRIHNYFFRMIREGKLQKDPEPELKTHRSKLR